jgi:hypothetical protein
LHRCLAGACRRADPSARCPVNDVNANEVVVIGDTFFAASHSITASLEDLARQAGVLGANERYRDYSSVLGNTLALQGNGIETQYATANAESRVRVVLMTGGGADVLLGSCDVVSPTCPLLVAAAQAARSLLSRMAADGVAHVVYAYYPDPTNAALRQKVDELRPLLASACASSPVPCHWVDLRPTFDGNAAYLGADGTTPTTEGALASAGAIWATMQAQCVAQ